MCFYFEDARTGKMCADFLQDALPELSIPGDGRIAGKANLGIFRQLKEGLDTFRQVYASLDTFKQVSAGLDTFKQV